MEPSASLCGAHHNTVNEPIQYLNSIDLVKPGKINIIPLWNLDTEGGPPVRPMVLGILFDEC